MKVMTAATRPYAILGSPIEHSKSPTLHNHGFAACGIDSVFLAFDAQDETIGDVMAALRTLNIAGGSVTMPVKRSIIPHLDGLSREAELIGAVNVYKNEAGRFIGYNTDGMGLVMLLEERGFAYKGKKVVMSGAGGAGRAVAIQMALSGAAEVVIFDMMEESAKDVADIINRNIETCTSRAYPSDETQVLKELADGASVYVDCTPLGMTPNEDTTMIHDFSSLSPELAVVDIVYAPLKTKLLKLAEEHGHPISNGIDMFFYQGAKAFKIWTGEELPIDKIKPEM